MKSILAATIVVVSLVACTNRAHRAERDTGAAERHSADTVVSKREMQDTAIIHHDTTITSDTVHKRGAHAVKTDTVKKP
jgi:uncharacterized lipoprotein NlpE involved in copper resistance